MYPHKHDYHDMPIKKKKKKGKVFLKRLKETRRGKTATQRQEIKTVRVANFQGDKSKKVQHTLVYKMTRRNYLIKN